MTENLNMLGPKKILNFSQILAKSFGILLMAVGVFFSLKLLFWTIDKKFSEIVPIEESQITAEVRDRQLGCLAKNIYHEAGSEPFEGKVAVAQVTMNRVASGKFADTVCGVVYQRTTAYDKVICQFSWFCEKNHVTRPIHTTLFKESEEVAKMVMLEGFTLPNMKEAIYYHADYVNPRWNKPKIGQIGRHIFYKERSGV